MTILVNRLKVCSQPWLCSVHRPLEFHFKMSKSTQKALSCVPLHGEPDISPEPTLIPLLLSQSPEFFYIVDPRTLLCDCQQVPPFHPHIQSYSTVRAKNYTHMMQLKMSSPRLNTSLCHIINNKSWPRYKIILRFRFLTYKMRIIKFRASQYHCDE